MKSIMEIGRKRVLYTISMPGAVASIVWTRGIVKRPRRVPFPVNLFDDIQWSTFDYFWSGAHPDTGLPTG